ncbi:MAG: PilN domain-containing protein [Gammaproteobacteria bacterium]|nr:PilN domain-containing protein [Gammaproteobacteria bacterium]
MDQNINLLAELSTPKSTLLYARSIVAISLTLLFILLAISGIKWIELKSDQSKLQPLQTKKQNLLSQIDVVTKELNSTKQEVPVLHNLISIDPSQLLGFSRYLDDLAEFTPEGIWLEELTFGQPADYITIKGTSLSASLVPTFLKALNKSDDLGKKPFTTLQLQKMENTNYIKFTLSTITETAAPIANATATTTTPISKAGKH